MSLSHRQVDRQTSFQKTSIIVPEAVLPTTIICEPFCFLLHRPFCKSRDKIHKNLMKYNVSLKNQCYYLWGYIYIRNIRRQDVKDIYAIATLNFVP